MRDLTVHDFVTGMIAACKLRGYETISLREDRFYAGMQAGYDRLMALADKYEVDVRFAVFLDPIHNDSPVIGQAVTTAVQRDLVSLDNPEYVNMRIKLDHDLAAALLNTLPGGDELYSELADVFIEAELARPEYV